MEMNGCVLNTVATGALTLEHQAIRIHWVDQISIALGQFRTKILCLLKTALKKQNKLE